MIATFAVFAAALLYFAAFRHYGLQVEDEGTLLFWLDRVASGQLPYVDFHTGYTPGFFHVCMAIRRLLGDSVGELRLALAIVNAGSAAMLYAIARRFAGSGYALAAPVLWVAFLPLYRGEFASFNVPYPAWFATFAWLATVLGLLRHLERPSRLALVAVGTGAALAFATKPNAGAYALAATTWVVVAASHPKGAVDRLAGLAATVAMAAGVWFAFGFALTGTDVAVHLLPLPLLLMLTAREALTGDGRGSAGTLGNLATVAAGFVLVTLAWALPLVARIGVGGFLREVLFIGSDAAYLYHWPHPAVEPYAAAVVAAAVAVAGCGWLVRTRRLPPVPLLAVGVGATAAALAASAAWSVMPESFGTSISLQLENAAYWLAPLTIWAGLLWVVIAPPNERRRLLALGISAPAMYWQLYPRADFTHVVTAAPMALVLAVALCARVAAWWSAGRWPERMAGSRVVGAVVATVVALAAANEALPAIASSLRCRGAEPVIDAARVQVRIDEEVADDLAAFGRAAAYLARHSEPEESVLTFPATSGLLFAAKRTNPVHHDYYFPGRPGQTEELEMVATLAAAPPRLVATLNTGWTFFQQAPVYYQALRQFVTARYRLTARFGRYDVLARDDVASSLPKMIEPFEPGPAGAAIEPWLARRRQAARRWMAGLTPAEAEAATLPADTGSAVLLLRALRDGGDVRAAGWLVAGLVSEEPRVRREAAVAMDSVASRYVATRLRWADDVRPADYRPFVDRYRSTIGLLAEQSQDGPRAMATVMRSILGCTGDCVQAR